jgi:hypothetical protein
MVLKPISRVLLRIPITLLGLWLALVVLRVTIFVVSLVLWVGAAFALL